jgi:hypothetical protein
MIEQRAWAKVVLFRWSLRALTQLNQMSRKALMVSRTIVSAAAGAKVVGVQIPWPW